MTSLLHVAVLLIFAFTAGADPVTDRYRILAFLPTPSKSHQRVWQPLLRELALRGHHVTYVSPVPLDNPPANFSHVALVDDEQLMENVMKRIDLDQSEVMDLRGFGKHFLVMKMTRAWGLALEEEILENSDVQNLIHSNLEFDAVILESSFAQESFIALQHRFKAVAIEITTAGNWHWIYWLHGNPFDPNYIVDTSVAFTDRMTLWEKIQNQVNSLITRGLWMWYIPQFQDLMDRLIQYPGWRSRPPIMEMIGRTSLVLVNAHHSLNYPYPVAPNFKEVGGLNLVPVKPLPKDLKEFMDGGKDGVIFFTMGSFWKVSTTLGDQITPVFIKVFSRLKQRILMKWEADFPDLPANIKISKWFPQQDILAHKNLRLFISHGGFLSMTEAVNQGVPILGIPLLGDQVKNIRNVEVNGYGLGLELTNITETSLSWAIEEMLNNPKYAENAKKQSTIFHDKPETALETAVFWTEYVIRHKGAPHLRPAIADMPWYRQIMIDVYSVMVAAVIIPVYLFYRILKFLCSCCIGSSKRLKKKHD